MGCPLSPLVALVPIAVLAACGSTTGELPASGGAGRTSDPSASPPAGPFADPAGGTLVDPFAERLGAVPVPTVATVAAGAPAGSPLPAFATAPPRFSDALADTPSFETGDPDAATLLGRLGHVALRELAEPLLAARYVDAYLSIDDAVLGVLADGAVGTDAGTRSLDCPEGGRLDVAGEPVAGGSTHDIVFRACRLDGATLDGRLLRTTPGDALRLGAGAMVELDYRGLSVEREDLAVTMTGATTSRRTVRRSDADCDGESVERSIVHRIERADVTRDGVTARVTDAAHALVRESESSRAGVNDCRERLVLTFEGRATVSGGGLGGTRATLGRDGRIVRDARGDREPPARARLDVAIDDGSALALELLSDLDGTARASVLAEGVAVSFTTAYRFEE